MAVMTRNDVTCHNCVLWQQSILKRFSQKGPIRRNSRADMDTTENRGSTAAQNFFDWPRSQTMQVSGVPGKHVRPTANGKVSGSLPPIFRTTAVHRLNNAGLGAG